MIFTGRNIVQAFCDSERSNVRAQQSPCKSQPPTHSSSLCLVLGETKLLQINFFWQRDEYDPGVHKALDYECEYGIVVHKDLEYESEYEIVVQSFLEYESKHGIVVQGDCLYFCKKALR